MFIFFGQEYIFSGDELSAICETLRYHTSSPHTMTHLYEGWIKQAESLTAQTVGS